MLKLDPKNHERVTWQERKERIPNDYDAPSQNELYASMKFKARVAGEFGDLGMKIGDFELLSQEEREVLLEWEHLLEEDIKNDSI